MNKRDVNKGRKIRGISILHVEDDPIIQLHLRTILEPLVEVLHAANNGAQGFKKFCAESPDIVITDIRMPEMDGMEMAANIRSMSPHTPIVVTSAYNDSDYLLRSIELNVDKYIIKPFDQDAVVELITHIAESLLAERRLQEANRLNKFLLDINPNFIVTMADGQVDYINTTFLKYLGFDSLESFRLSGADLDSFIFPVDEDNNEDLTLEGLSTTECSGKMVRLNSPVPDSGQGYFLVSSNRLPDSEVYVVSFTDITRLEVEKQSLAFQAATDHLTGLCNRMTFTRLLAEEIGRVKRHTLTSSLIMFDLDDFKHVNDTFGHNVGDQVLIDVAAIIGKSIRQGDILSRWGGEEFLLLAPGCDNDQARGLAEKLRTVMEDNSFGGQPSVTASFGATRILPDETVTDLVERVDRAMYRSKTDGKNRVTVL
ncbi:MAG: diguanylate cyclase [Desulfovibrio sp.]|uniref:GGDEF domain-containing response regulator n=1 Tax=Desulfovibrio sp. 7SRBS1 TaxID=3378064 RepID=UPI003B41F8CB